jgi:hypothetical protein
VTETAPEKDANGRDIPGSARRCFVEMDLPPGLTDAEKRSRDAIERACRRAVYEEGLVEYGNKQLRVGSFGDIFSNNYERVSVVRLMTPEKAEKFRASSGKGVSLDNEDEETEPSTYDDEDDGDAEGGA